MDQTNRQQIEVICDRLSDLRTRASKEGNGLLAHLIAETLEEAEKVRISAISPERARVRRNEFRDRPINRHFNSTTITRAHAPRSPCSPGSKRYSSIRISSRRAKERGLCACCHDLRPIKAGASRSSRAQWRHFEALQDARSTYPIVNQTANGSRTQ